MKYNKIVKCNFESFKDNEVIYGNVYLLTYDGCSEELEIDLTSNLWFNTEYRAINKKVVMEVENINQVLDFLKEHNITISDYAKKDIFDNEKQLLYVGGSRDLVLDFDLNIIGLIDYEEVKEYIKNRKRNVLNGYEKLVKFEYEEVIKANNNKFEKLDLTNEDYTKITDTIMEDLVGTIQNAIYKYIDNNFKERTTFERKEN